MAGLVAMATGGIGPAAISLYVAGILVALPTTVSGPLVADRGRRGDFAFGAGFLAVLAALLHPVWAWAAAFGLTLEGEPAQLCREAGVVGTPDVTRLLAPPVTLCGPNPLGFPVVISSWPVAIGGSLLVLVLVGMTVSALFLMRWSLPLPSALETPTSA